MTEATRAEAEAFLEAITAEDNIALVTDHDPDGFTSGTLFYDFCKKKGAKVSQFTFVRGISDPKHFDFSSFTKIITTDLPASQIGPTLRQYTLPTMFMDHHPRDAELPDNVIEYRTLERGYIPSARSAYELTGGKEWIALAGVIGDVGDRYPENEDFIERALSVLEMTLEDFKKRIVFPLSNCILYLEKDPDKAFDTIQRMQEPSDIASLLPYSQPIEDEVAATIARFEKEKEDLGGVNYFYFESKHNIKARVNGISLEPGNEEQVYLFATPKTDTMIGLSARSQTKRMNMADLLRGGIVGLEGASAGGHFAASGGTIRKEDLDQFKENVQKFLKENPLG